MNEYRVEMVVKERVGKHWGKVDSVVTSPEQALHILHDKYVSKGLLKKLDAMYKLTTESIESVLKK